MGGTNRLSTMGNVGRCSTSEIKWFKKRACHGLKNEAMERDEKERIGLDLGDGGIF